MAKDKSEYSNKKNQKQASNDYKMQQLEKKRLIKLYFRFQTFGVIYLIMYRMTYFRFKMLSKVNI